VYRYANTKNSFGEIRLTGFVLGILRKSSYGTL
jgi:hypothetical protein